MNSFLIPNLPTSLLLANNTYTTFTLSWVSSTYSESEISGMFHPHETGCNGHVPIHGNCNTECITSHAHTLNVSTETQHKDLEEVHTVIL